MTDQLMVRKRRWDPCWKPGDRGKVDWGDIVYLENDGITITAPNGRKLRIRGSPNSSFLHKMAFQYAPTQNFWHGKADKFRHAHHTISTLRTSGIPLPAVITYCMSLGLIALVFMSLGVRENTKEPSGCTVVVSKCHNGGFYNLWEVIKGFVQSWCRPVTEAKTLFVNACIDG
ncbi:uncharacterized protein N7529_004615 [Penicillium soppii]|uniref:uncharacterized protein n=1 Tax=Penicillium soppii TaxID=69789 RepID=UPI002548D073|nr:uncharacterized protein N7529_004615 [Penicillium soppii]KAJ5872262.1 hypothetical protein N7529_004615 [Penicillium soppii]